MENEKKIIEMLGKHQADITEMKSDIAEMKSDVSGIQTKITNIESDISGMQTKITNIESDISGMQTKITSIESDISGMQTKITNVEFDVSDIKQRMLKSEIIHENETGPTIKKILEVVQDLQKDNKRYERLETKVHEHDDRIWALEQAVKASQG